MSTILRPLAFLTAVPFLTAWLCLTGHAGTDKYQVEEKGSLPPAAEDILTEVRMRMPSEPLLIKGRLLTGKRLGTLKKAFYVEVLLKLGGKPISAQYTLMDMFGAPVERLTIIREPDQSPEFHYEKGNPLQIASMPDLDRAIEGTNITWNDLSLSFLWWQNGTTIGRENRKGRDCVIIEFAPENQFFSAQTTTHPSVTESGANSRISTDPIMRVWIDAKLFMLIQMEEYNGSHKRKRRLSVKKIKKTSDMWMVKDMEACSYPSKHRTLLRIDDISRLSENEK